MLGAAAAAATLAGCSGFELRRDPPLALRRVALVGFAPRSPMADELRARLALQGVATVASPAEADVVLRATEDSTLRNVIASTAAGQVREVRLRVRLALRVESPGGAEVAPPARFEPTRDVSYSETAALAKEQEERELLAAMRADVALQVLRRLASARPASGAASAASAPR